MTAIFMAVLAGVCCVAENAMLPELFAVRFLGRLALAEQPEQRQIVGDFEHAAENQRPAEGGARQQAPGYCRADGSGERARNRGSARDEFASPRSQGQTGSVMHGDLACRL